MLYFLLKKSGGMSWMPPAATTQTATVMAKSRCSVVKVPKDQFADLIKSNPATIHTLLIDMANSIVNLNEQLVGLRGSYVN